MKKTKVKTRGRDYEKENNRNFMEKRLIKMDT